MKESLSLSYNTVYKALTAIRFAILAHALDARQLMGENSALGLTLPGRVLVLDDDEPFRRRLLAVDEEDDELAGDGLLGVEGDA